MSSRILQVAPILEQGVIDVLLGEPLPYEYGVQLVLDLLELLLIQLMEVQDLHPAQHASYLGAGTVNEQAVLGRGF